MSKARQLMIDKGKVAIDPDLFPELLTEMRIATADEELRLEKKDEYTMDLLDSLRLAFEYIAILLRSSIRNLELLFLFCKVTLIFCISPRLF